MHNRIALTYNIKTSLVFLRCPSIEPQSLGSPNPWVHENLREPSKEAPNRTTTILELHGQPSGTRAPTSRNDPFQQKEPLGPPSPSASSSQPPFSSSRSPTLPPHSSPTRTPPPLCSLPPAPFRRGIPHIEPFERPS